MRTILGVSNISFGLPCRGYLNTTFLTMAMAAGLDLAIMNPNTPEMMAAVRAYRVLTARDPPEHGLCGSLRQRTDRKPPGGPGGEPDPVRRAGGGGMRLRRRCAAA